MVSRRGPARAPLRHFGELDCPIFGVEKQTEKRNGSSSRTGKVTIVDRLMRADFFQTPRRSRTLVLATWGCETALGSPWSERTSRGYAQRGATAVAKLRDDFVRGSFSRTSFGPPRADPEERRRRATILL